MALLNLFLFLTLNFAVIKCIFNLYSVINHINRASKIALNKLRNRYSNMHTVYKVHCNNLSLNIIIGIILCNFYICLFLLLICEMMSLAGMVSNYGPSFFYFLQPAISAKKMPKNLSQTQSGFFNSPFSF